MNLHNTGAEKYPLKPVRLLHEPGGGKAEQDVSLAAIHYFLARANSPDISPKHRVSICQALLCCSSIGEQCITL